MTAAEHVAGQLDLAGTPVPPAEVAKPNPTSIVLSVDLEFDLSASECWPDGEPEQWTVETLAKVIKDHGRLERFLDDWGLLDMGGSVSVHDGRGNWATVNLR